MVIILVGVIGNTRDSRKPHGYGYSAKSVVETVESVRV